jgi:hypothetical protein
VTIHVEPKNADALAAALREDTASPEDLQRIERGLSRTLRARSGPAPRRSLVPAGLALAAVVVAIVWFARPSDETVAPAPIARVDTARVGQVIEGPAAVETQLGNARLAVGAASSLRVDEVDVTRAAVTLARGQVRVAFHPEHRGEEHLAVWTAAARVDVVGTEFVVTITEDGGTRVEVTEGIVRVTPTSGAAATLVHAGESIDVAIAVAAVEVEMETEVMPVIEASTPSRVDGEPRVRPTVAPEVTVTEAHAAELAALDGEQLDRGRERDYAGLVETTTRILELEPHTLRGADALFDRAQTRELHLADPGHARADYERYVRDFPNGPHVAQAQQGIERLSLFPSTP